MQLAACGMKHHLVSLHLLALVDKLCRKESPLSRVHGVLLFHAVKHEGVAVTVEVVVGGENHIIHPLLRDRSFCPLPTRKNIGTM